MMNKTVSGGLELYYDVERLGAGVAENVANLIHLYAERAGVRGLPPITLSGSAWQKPWLKIRASLSVAGNAGSSAEEERYGITYRCLLLEIRGTVLSSAHLYPSNVEGTIAHEMTHLRWWTLPHGREFDARTLALLRGAKFPAQGSCSWCKATHEIMRKARIDTGRFFECWSQRFTRENNASDGKEKTSLTNEKTDRSVLITGLALAGVRFDSHKGDAAALFDSMVIGNLHLLFNKQGRLIRVRIVGENSLVFSDYPVDLPRERFV